jgi:hypothetical protein
MRLLKQSSLESVAGQHGHAIKTDKKGPAHEGRETYEKYKFVCSSLERSNRGVVRQLAEEKLATGKDGRLRH